MDVLDGLWSKFRQYCLNYMKIDDFERSSGAIIAVLCVIAVYIAITWLENAQK